MMQPESTPPKMSVEEIGNSLSSLGFDARNSSLSKQEIRRQHMGTPTPRRQKQQQQVSPRVVQLPNHTPMIGTTTTTTLDWNDRRSNTAAAPQVVVIREEDLRLLSDTLGNLLDSADETLSGLEQDRDLLPNAILRKCHEFADGLGGLAGELEGQTAQEQDQLVDAIREDLKLYENDQQMVENDDETATTIIWNKKREPPSRQDIVEALSGASTLLRDVEAAFREVGNEEAKEIAETALIMARLFLLSLQNIHSNLLEATGGDETDKDSTVWIEELSDETADSEQPQKKRIRRRPYHRMRVLWPPLGPGVDAAMAWTKGEASRRPYLAVALGLTMWPAVVSTALLGTSIAWIDSVAQNTYETFEDGPWISALEQTAAQAYQAGKLTMATTKLVGRQSLRVASRQIDRRGGLGPIAKDLGVMALDRITHPIDTIQQVWGGLQWGFGAVKDATEDYLEMRNREQQETSI